MNRAQAEIWLDQMIVANREQRPLRDDLLRGAMEIVAEVRRQWGQVSELRALVEYRQDPPKDFADPQGQPSASEVKAARLIEEIAARVDLDDDLATTGPATFSAEVVNGIREALTSAKALRLRLQMALATGNRDSADHLTRLVVDSVRKDRKARLSTHSWDPPTGVGGVEHFQQCRKCGACHVVAMFNGRKEFVYVQPDLTETFRAGICSGSATTESASAVRELALSIHVGSRSKQ